MTPPPNDEQAFDLAEYPLPFGTVVEASAGTGKTYSVAAYVTHALATDDQIRIGSILVTTYTRNAAAELRDRIRGRLLSTARLLRADTGQGRDALDATLLAVDDAERRAMIHRLDRAVSEFDTATIGTIHSVCGRVLRMAGLEPGTAGDEDLLERTVAEAVNDAVVTEAAAGRAWDESRLAALVTVALRDPFLVPWFDPTGRPPADLERLEQAAAIVRACVSRVQGAMRASPSFDDLLRLAWEEVRKPERAGLVGELRRRFRLAIIDEAQDTSRLQWEFLHELFPAANAHDQTGGIGQRLVAVGDPKQAIYGFRGADVTAYLRFASGDGTGRPHRTLAINFRSDGPLLAALNTAMGGASFGPGIAYQPVTAADHRAASKLVDLPAFECIGLGDAEASDAAARKVFELLDRGRLTGGSAGDAEPPERAIRPRDICVLVRINDIGKTIEERLARAGIPAVSTGTASVMDGQIADDLRLLVEAMERPGSGSRIRRAAATLFFGYPLTEVGRLGEETELAVQERIAGLHALLQARGIAAVRTAIMEDVEMAGRLAAGPDGERHLVDLAHVVELLHDATAGRGCHARGLLEQLVELAGRDEKSELVSRRVESDEDAVRIMSVHVAKGLEFPCVIVVDDWKERTNPPRGPAVFYAGTERRLDLAYALSGSASPLAAASVLAADNEELRRLLYVALTRPQHHLCLVRNTAIEAGVLDAVLTDPPPLREAADLPPLPRRWQPPTDSTRPPTPPAVAPLPSSVKQTYRRTSFSGIVAAAASRHADIHAPPGHGHDEAISGTADGDVASEAAATSDGSPRSDAPSPDLGAFVLPDLPAGTAFGSAVHEIFERLEVEPTADAPIREATVASVVGDVAASAVLRPHRESLAAMIAATLDTPFGGPATAPFRSLRFADFPPGDRLAELDFEMGLANLAAGVKASDVGRVLAASLPPGDMLADYAQMLAGPTFDLPLGGMITGSIDAVLRLPDRPADDPRLLIADYKTNRLHRRDARQPLAAYAPGRLVAAMIDHHYPLQALVYGTAVYRMLRWRLGAAKPAGWDAGACIAGVIYGFTRGMLGPDTPEDDAGHRYGVFAWVPPPTLWRRLSDLFAGAAVEASR